MNGHRLTLNPYFNIKASFKRFRRLQQEFIALADLVTDIIGKPTVCIRNIAAADMPAATPPIIRVLGIVPPKKEF